MEYKWGEKEDKKINPIVWVSKVHLNYTPTHIVSFHTLQIDGDLYKIKKLWHGINLLL